MESLDRVALEENCLLETVEREQTEEQRHRQNEDTLLGHSRGLQLHVVSHQHPQHEQRLSQVSSDAVSL